MSGDRFVEVTRQGYFQRLAGSFFGIIVGFVLVFGSIPLLWWNEGRAVKAQRTLDEATRLVVDTESDRIDPANNGKLVHVTGDAISHTPVRDGDLALVFNDVIVVSRKVEMYQWLENKESHTTQEVGGSERTETTYSYHQGWSDEWKNSEEFKHPTGHANPQMPMKSQRWNATEATLGAFKLEREALQQLDDGTPFKPETTPEGWKDNGQTLYRGDDPASPKLGDLRVSYTVLAAPAPMSVMGRQMGSGFEPYEMPTGKSVFLVEDGHKSSEEMIRHQRERENLISWALRAGGLLLLWLGFSLVMGPLRALANVLPFLANVAGFAIGVVALALALPIGLGTIGVAWLFYRPIIGAVVLVVGFVAGYFLVKHRHRIAPPAGAPAPT